MTRQFFAADPAMWPATANAIPRPWPIEAIYIDLAYWQDRQRVGIKRPGRDALRERWGVKDHEAKKALKDEHIWGDGFQDSTRNPPEIRQDSTRNPPAAARTNAENGAISTRIPPEIHQESARNPPHARNTTQKHRTQNTEEEEGAPADAAADVRPPKSREDVQRVWDLLRSLDTETKRRPEPPKGWGIGQRIDEHGEEVVALVVEWAYTAPAYVGGRQTRAGFLRESGHVDRTLFRESNLVEYAALAQKWAALGKPKDKPTATSRPDDAAPVVTQDDGTARFLIDCAKRDGPEWVAETFTDDALGAALDRAGGVEALRAALDDPENMTVYRERLAAELRGRLEAA